MDNKEKRGFFFNNSNNPSDIDDEFERMRKEMEDLAKRMMPNLNIREFERMAQDRGNMMVHGFSIRMGQDGKPVIREFGNAKGVVSVPIVQQGNAEMPETEREPLIDVIEGKNSITIIAEVPGADAKDILVEGIGKKLEIKVLSGARKYHKMLELPKDVNHSKKRTNYKNGVLEIILPF